MIWFDRYQPQQFSSRDRGTSSNEKWKHTNLQITFYIWLTMPSL